VARVTIDASAVVAMRRCVIMRFLSNFLVLLTRFRVQYFERLSEDMNKS
jgi:hypothetical protein